MNENEAIVRAADAARNAGEEAILATVVGVRGSAYRRPGARMLLTPNGWQAGSISGGCLESDVLRKAWWHTQGGKPALVTYDSTAEDDADEDELAWGFGLGCSGVVEVLLERLAPAATPACPVAFLADCLRRDCSGVLATVIAVEGETSVTVGQRLLLSDTHRACTLPDDTLIAAIEADARIANASRTVVYDLTNGARAEVFLEVVTPPVPLVICGAGHDAIPLSQLAKSLGWRVTVVDPQPGVLARPDRFPDADTVLSCAPADLPVRVPLTDRTLAVVMSHNVMRDGAVLAALLPSPVRYIGVLGPRRRTERLLQSLETDWDPRLHAPVGLDIGADTPETIALSILAEMQATLTDRSGGFLRDRNQPIHNPPVRLENAPPRPTSEPVTCALSHGT